MTRRVTARTVPALAALAWACLAGLASAETLERHMLEAFSHALFEPHHVTRVRRGEIARIDGKPLDLRELAAGVACMVDKPTAEVLAPFADVVSTIPGSSLGDFAQIDPRDPGPAFARLSLGPAADSEIIHYRDFEGGVGVNLSAGEMAAADRVPADADDAAMDTFVRSLARGRFDGYLGAGLDGIPPYVRGPGWEIQPAEEMLRDLAELAYLPELSPPLLAAWRDYPENRPENLQEGHYWLRADLDKRPAMILTHRMQLSDAAADIVAIRHYYFSHFFDSAQALAVVSEVPEGRLLVYASRFWVDGWSGSPRLKQKLGQKMLVKKMSRLLEEQGVCAN